MRPAEDRFHPNHPCFAPECEGCGVNLDRQRCRCDDERLCSSCRHYHRPSEDCAPEGRIDV